MQEGMKFRICDYVLVCKLRLFHLRDMCVDLQMQTLLNLTPRLRIRSLNFWKTRRGLFKNEEL